MASRRVCPSRQELVFLSSLVGLHFHGSEVAVRGCPARLALGKVGIESNALLFFQMSLNNPDLLKKCGNKDIEQYFVFS